MIRVFEGEDGFQRMLSAMEDDQKYAETRATEEQKKLADGNKHYAVAFPDYPERLKPGFFAIFSIIEDANENKKNTEKFVEEVNQLESKSEDQEEQLAERLYELEVTKGSLERGIVFTESFSLACPEGEPGSKNVAVMYEISEEAFELSRRAGWRMTQEVINEVNDSLAKILFNGAL